MLYPFPCRTCRINLTVSHAILVSAALVSVEVDAWNSELADEVSEWTEVLGGIREAAAQASRFTKAISQAPVKTIRYLRVREMVGLLRGAALVLTNTFHGLHIATMTRRQVLVFIRRVT